MVSLHRGRFVVVHQCSSFSIDPLIFFGGGNFYQKLPILAIFGAEKATFLKLQRQNFAWGCGPGAPSPTQNFVKPLKGIYPSGANLYQKLPFWQCFGLAMFWAVSPHLLNQNGKIWREGANLGDRPPTKFCKICSRGYTPFGQIYTKKHQFRRFWALYSHIFNPQWRNLEWGYEPGAPSSKPYFVKIA